MADINNADDANAIINNPESAPADVVLAKAFLAAQSAASTAPASTTAAPAAPATEDKTSAPAPAAESAAPAAPAAPAPAAPAAAAPAAATADVAPAAKAPSILADLTTQIKAVENAGKAQEHGALVSFHAELASLKQKLQLILPHLKEEAQEFAQYLHKIL
jgi:hypothetical protein